MPNIQLNNEVNEDDEVMVSCSNCNDEHNEDHSYSFDGDVYCEECYHEHFSMCEGCEDTFCNDDIVYSEVEEKHYCQSCFDENVRVCCSCSSEVSEDDCYIGDDDTYCQDCYNENYTYCEDCNEYYSSDYVYYNESDEVYRCEDCNTENSNDNNEHDEIECQDNTYNEIKFNRKYGIELEIDDANIDIDKIRNTQFNITNDGSLDCGYEFVSPIMQGDIGSQEIKKLTDILKDNTCTKKSGYHLHIDARDLDYKSIQKIMVLYNIIEDVIFRMLPISRYVNTYCKKSDKSINDILNCKSLEDIKNLWYSGNLSSDRYCNTRYYNLNIHSYFYQQSIEIRSHSGTKDYNKVIQWINFHLHLIDYAVNHSMTDILALKTLLDDMSMQKLSLTRCIMVLNYLGFKDGFKIYYTARFNKFQHCYNR